jgi:hypothetical protein
MVLLGYFVGFEVLGEGVGSESRHGAPQKNHSHILQRDCDFVNSHKAENMIEDESDLW